MYQFVYNIYLLVYVHSFILEMLKKKSEIFIFYFRIFILI